MKERVKIAAAAAAAADDDDSQLLFTCIYFDA